MSVSHSVGLAQTSRPTNGLFWLRSVSCSWRRWWCSPAASSLSRLYSAFPIFPGAPDAGADAAPRCFIFNMHTQPSIPDPSHGRAPVATATPQFWGRGARNAHPWRNAALALPLSLWQPAQRPTPSPFPEKAQPRRLLYL